MVRPIGSPKIAQPAESLKEKFQSKENVVILSYKNFFFLTLL